MDLLDYWDSGRYDTQLLELVFMSTTIGGERLTPKMKLDFADIISFYTSHKQECQVIEDKYGQEFLTKYILKKVENIWG